MAEEIGLAHAGRAEGAAREHRGERINDVGEFRPAWNPDVAQPRHRHVFLRGANRLSVYFRRLRQARPRGRVVAALLLLRRDALKLRDLTAALSRLADDLHHLAGAEDQRYQRRHGSDQLQRGVEEFRDGLHDCYGQRRRAALNFGSLPVFLRSAPYISSSTNSTHLNSRSCARLSCLR